MCAFFYKLRSTQILTASTYMVIIIPFENGI